MALPSLKDNLTSNGHIELDNEKSRPWDASFMSRRNTDASSAAGSFSLDDIQDQGLKSEANSAMICSRSYLWKGLDDYHRYFLLDIHSLYDRGCFDDK